MVPIRRHARNRSAYVAAGLIAACALCGASGNPKQSPKNHAVAAGDNHGAFHIAVYVENPAKDTSEPNEQPEDKKSSGIDQGTMWIIVFGFAQAAFIGVQAWIGYNQIRPYVFIQDAHIRRTGNDWIINYRVQNNGNSPAHKVRSVDITTIVDWEPVGPLPEPLHKDTLGSIGPGGDYVDASGHNVPIDLVNGVAVIGETKAVLLRGRIDYRDAFLVPHRTDFCFYSTGVIEMNGDRMDAWSEGNDST
jgi:hypothetical protein